MKEIENQRFVKITYTDLKEQTFSGCFFEACNFTNAELLGTRMLDCLIQNGNFSMTKVDGLRLQNVSFENCKFVGINFGKCDQQFLKISFRNCLLDTCNFANMNIRATPFINCAIRSTYFSESNLSESNFAESNLEGSIFHRCDLSKCQFQKSINYSINPATNKLKQARFSKPEVLSLLEHFDIVIE